MPKKLSADASAKLSQKLKNNPAGTALLLLDPIKGLKNLGFSLTSSELEQFEGPSPEDARLEGAPLADLLGKASATVDHTPQIIQVAKDQAMLRPPIAADGKFERDPDMTIQISAAILQYGVDRYAKKSFLGKKFDGFPAKDWWQLSATGESLGISLDTSGIKLLARFACELSLDLDLETVRFKADDINFPVTVAVEPAFVLDESDGQFYLSISRGQISLLDFVWRTSMTEDLSEQLAEIIPYIPICSVPTGFSLPAVDTTTEKDLLFTGCRITGADISLQFHIDDKFTAQRSSSKPVTNGSLISDKKNSPRNSSDVVVENESSGAAASTAESAAPLSSSVQMLPDNWVGLDYLWTYDNYKKSAETELISCGQGAMASIADFFQRNPFGNLPPDKNNPQTPDGRKHYDNLAFVGKFFEWFPPTGNIPMTNLRWTTSDDIKKAMDNLNLKYRDYYPGMLEGPENFRNALIQRIVKTKTPVLTQLDLPALKPVMNIKNGQKTYPFANEPNFTMHWGLIFAVCSSGVKLGSWRDEFIIPWNYFMDAWRCKVLPYPNNYYQMHIGPA